MELDIEAERKIVSKGYERGILLVSAGANVVRFVPPLTITREELATAASILGDILREM